MKRLAEAYHAASRRRRRGCGLRRSPPSATWPARPPPAPPARSTSCTRASPGGCGAGSGRPRCRSSSPTTGSPAARTRRPASSPARSCAPARTRPARAQSPDAPSIERTPAGRVVVSALNGAFGDTLAQRGNPLALRDGGPPRRAATSDSTAAELRRAYPNAKPRLAVFVHGLCETDEAWKASRRPAVTSPTGTGWRSSSATRRCTCATTPAATSPRTAASSRRCSRTSSRPGRCRSTRSC